MSTPENIEAYLFYTGERHSYKEIAKVLEITPEEAKEAALALSEKLSGGIRVVYDEEGVQLATAPEAAELIGSIRKEELSRDLGKAGLETLSVIAYRGPISRSEIEYIRGVNSSFILRNLLVRGLIEREQDEKNARVYRYKPTLTLFQYLGITSREELPEYQNIEEKLRAVWDEQEEEEQTEQNND